MNLANLSDQIILKNTKNLVIQEKKLTANIIDHLQIIEQRKLYCDLKYKSLFDYAVNELAYSEDQAYRRLSAMRLSRKVPAVKEKISNTTKAACQGILADLKSEKGIAPQPKKPKVNNEGSQSVRLHLSLPKLTMEKITDLQGLFAHQKLELAKIVDLMADALLEKKKAELMGIKLNGKGNGKVKKSQQKKQERIKEKSIESTPSYHQINE